MIKVLIGLVFFSIVPALIAPLSAQAACFKSSNYSGHGNFNDCVKADNQQRQIKTAQGELQDIVKEQARMIGELQEELDARNALNEVNPLGGLYSPEAAEVVEPNK